MDNTTREIRWTTPSGKIVTMQHITRRESIADHTVMVDCDDIDIRVDGNLRIGYAGIVDHPTAGKVIQVCGAKIYIAPEILADVISMDKAYHDRYTARLKASMLADKEYTAHVSRINNAMTLNGTSL
jgi:hypothetical protein